MTDIWLACLGYGLVGTFMWAVMRRWLTALVALIVLPALFCFLVGKIENLGSYMQAGVEQVAPTAVMLIFAVLYFGLMIDAGLFQPLVRVIVRWAGNDPARATVGHAAISSGVGLDGDGTTTILVGSSSILPVYRRLGIDGLTYASIGVFSFIIMNMTPWAGPAARIAAALQVDPMVLFLPLIPVMASGLAAVFVAAWFIGRRERPRVAKLDSQEETLIDDGALTAAFHSDPMALRPRMLGVNFILTAVLMVSVVAHLAPLHVLFMVGTALALMVNYRQRAEQQARLVSHGLNAFNVGLMVLAAGAFTGVLSGTGMIDAMATTLLAALPDWLGPHLAPVTALLSIPGNFFLSSDAFYFGVVPILARSAAEYGIPADAIGRAAMLGGPLHGLSPIVAAVYLNCELAGVELGDLQRYALKYAIGLSAILIIAALLCGAIPF